MSKYRTFIPVMESNEQDGYTVSATSGTGNAHYRAFDGIKDGSSGQGGAYRSMISPSLPEYLTITFPEPKLIGRYTVYLGYYNTQYSNMQTWDFEGLVNGEWMLLHSGENPVQESATLTFDFTPTEVEGVRIKCKTRHGTNSWGIDELEVFEYVIHHKILLLSEKDSGYKTIKHIKIDNLTEGVNQNNSNIGLAYSGVNENDAFKPFTSNQSDSIVLNGGSRYGTDLKNLWVSFEFNEPRSSTGVFIKYNEIGLSDIYASKIDRFVIEGSNDGENFTNIKEVENTGSNRSSMDSIILFDSRVKYKHYRFRITQIEAPTNSAGTNLSILHFMDDFFVVKDVFENFFEKFGLSSQEFSSIDFSSDFTGKHYVQNQSRPLGSGKVFEQPLDVDKIIKSVKIT